MSGRWPAFAAREAVLADLERAIAAAPAALDTRFYYASFLRDHGRLDEAIAIFADVLAAAPEHVETLVAYGAALARAGRRLDARAVLERAVERDAAHYVAAVSLANLLALDDPDRASALYAAAIALDATREAAHRGACSVAAARGDRVAAARHRAAGYASGPFTRRAYFGEGMPRAVLALVSTDGGNIPLDALIDPYRFAASELFVEAYRDETLPPHDVIVNAIADADRAGDALRVAERIAERSRAPLINAPAAVARTGRIDNAARLGHLAGVIAPATCVARAGAAAPALPAIVRVPGLHMGRGMVLARDAAAYARALVQLTGRDDPLAIQYVETRSSDGAWRKYRMMSIDGALYPLHLAVARRWDVHYFSSAMWERADYRAEEAAFLADPHASLGAAAWDALRRIFAVLALDYAGIDFGIAPGGDVVVFEANPAMTVLPPDADERFAYRRPAAERIATALRAMLDARENRR